MHTYQVNLTRMPHGAPAVSARTLSFSIAAKNIGDALDLAALICAPADAVRSVVLELYEVA